MYFCVWKCLNVLDVDVQGKSKKRQSSSQFCKKQEKSTKDRGICLSCFSTIIVKNQSRSFSVERSFKNTSYFAVKLDFETSLSLASSHACAITIPSCTTIAVIWSTQNRGSGRDMNVMEAWRKGYTGKGIVVAVVDDGVNGTNSDLSQNFVCTEKNTALTVCQQLCIVFS